MKYFFQWLFPILTIFVILAAVLLPQQVSIFQDQKLYNEIHTEELKIENMPSVQEPERDLIKPIYLLLDWLGYRETSSLAVINREISETESTPEERKEMTELLFLELKNLKEYKLIQEDSFIKPQIDGNWFYLQNQKEETGNWFLSVELYDMDTEEGLWIILDKESGKILFLSIITLEWKQEKTAEEIGKIFLDQIGLDYKLISDDRNMAFFSLTDTEVRYYVHYDENELQFFPQILINEKTDNYSSNYSYSEKK